MAISPSLSNLRTCLARPPVGSDCVLEVRYAHFLFQATAASQLTREEITKSCSADCHHQVARCGPSLVIDKSSGASKPSSEKSTGTASIKVLRTLLAPAGISKEGRCHALVDSTWFNMFQHGSTWFNMVLGSLLQDS